MVDITHLDKFIATKLSLNEKCDHPRLVFYTDAKKCSVKDLSIKACDEDDDDDDDDDRGDRRDRDRDRGDRNDGGDDDDDDDEMQKV